MLSVVTTGQGHDELRLDLDQIVPEGAREAEVDDYLAAAEREDGGRRLVLGNGHARQRHEVLALLYLAGLSTGDFVAALEGFFGSAAGLSAAAVGRLPTTWQADYQAFCGRDLTERDDVDVWADGVHLRVRPEQARSCCLVIVGVRADGTKELVALADGERESTDHWAELLRDLRRRGMRAPVVAVGDGALGLWAALREVFPATRHQRDWVHKAANVLSCLPKAAQAGAGKALAEIRDAPDRAHAHHAIEAFAGDDRVKWPKAVAKITNDAEELLTFLDFPAEHWQHLKTSNPIESTFSSVRLRTRVTKGPGSKAAGLAMAFKLLEAAP
jgi:putative transposase